MKRILQITGQLARNGTETFIMNVYRNIDRKKIAFDFLVSTISTDGYYEEAESFGAMIYRIPERRYFLYHHKALNDFFKENAHRYDAIHFNGGSFSSIDVFYYAKLYGVPMRIAHIHSSQTSGLHNIVLHKINRMLIPILATDFFACSDLAANWGYKYTSALKKCKVINNGIDLKKFYFDAAIRQRKRTELCLEGKLVIGGIGRLTMVKNYTFLLDVFQKVKVVNKDAVLVIAGDGELREELIDKIKNLGLEDSVRLLGIRTDIPEIMQALDIFAMPSLWEGLPFVLVEAQASGLPCIVSDTISLNTDLTGNVRFLSLKNVDTWRDALLAPPSVGRLAVQKSTLLQRFDIKATVKKLTDIYIRS